MKKTISLVMILALALFVEAATADYIFGTPTNLGPTVNSSERDLDSSISSDGLSLYFGSNRSGGFGGWDIWMTTRETTDTEWGAPVNLGSPINTSSGDSSPRIAHDSLTLFFISNRPGGYGGFDIWATTRETKNDQWGTPVNLGSTINSSATDGIGSISSDNLTLYLISDRPGGYGGWDILVSTRATSSESWTMPVNLGPTVNTSAEEGNPCVLPDGGMLILSSDRPGGSGGHDLYTTTRMSGDSEWGTPVNLGPVVNSRDGDELPSISADGRTLYFSSNRSGGNGAYDLWQASVFRITASNPSPANGQTDVPRNVVLSWIPGDFVGTLSPKHQIFFSENYDDITNGVGGVTQDENLYPVSATLDLDLGKTYYWRVDEVNDLHPDSPWVGNVWSFTTEPIAYAIDGANITATASSVGQADFDPEKTIDGSGLDENDRHSTAATDMWLSANELAGAWIQYEFDKMHKLHELWVWNSNQTFEALFGFGFRDVTVEYSTNGTDWTALTGVPEFAMAPGTDDYAHNTTVDFGGAMAKFVRLTAASNWGGILPQYSLSEVRFFAIPIHARAPFPDSGAMDVDPDVTLSWRAGREAATHNVYLSTEEQAVIDDTAFIINQIETSYNPGALIQGATYYWRVDEVEADGTTTHAGDVWSFTVTAF